MKRNADTVRRARENRAKIGGAEEKLWKLLRNRQFSARKFRRQHTIGIYAVDFACPAVHLVIEVDGESHNDPEQREFDEQRTELSSTRGLACGSVQERRAVG